MKEMGLIKTDKFLRINEVMSLIGLSRSQIYVLVSRREFPKQVKVSEKASAWLANGCDLALRPMIVNKNTVAKERQEFVCYCWALRSCTVLGCGHSRKIAY